MNDFGGAYVLCAVCSLPVLKTNELMRGWVRRIPAKPTPREGCANTPHAFEDSWKNRRPLGATVPRDSVPDDDERATLASDFQPDEGGEA